MSHEHIQLLKQFYFFENGTIQSKNPEQKTQWAHTINGLLKILGGEHTFQPPVENLVASMEQGHGIVATTPEEEFAGFVKLTPWSLVEENTIKMIETPDDFQAIGTPLCVEIGSLVVDPPSQGKNLGKGLVDHAVKIAKEKYPNLPIVAVVTNDNVPSLHVFAKLGWPVTTQENAKEITGFDLLEGWTPPSTIFLFPGDEPIVDFNN
jgi:ribosomal protein S18 acetylase RimI-like enzyme